MDIDISAILTALGLSPAAVAIIVPIIIAIASTLDAAIPQPSADSRWYWPRKVLSWLAINLGHARNASAPTRADGASSGPSTGTGTTASILLAMTMIAVTAALSACAFADKSPATQLYTIRAAYDASVLAPAAAYAGLPRCDDVTPAPCSQADVVAEIRKADAAALAILDASEEVVRNHPDMDASAAIDAAQQAVSAARKILITYNVIKE